MISLGGRKDKRKTMLFIVIKAVLARTLFAVHSVVCVWRVVDIKQGNPNYWLLTIGVGCLAFEGLVSICKQRGRELKWFSPSVFIYLCCIIPPMWIMELDLAYSRTLLRSDETSHQHLAYGKNNSREFSALEMVINVQLPSELWTKLLEQFLMVNLILGRWLLPKGDLTRSQLSQLLLVYIGMAADIVELFEAFKEDVVSGSLELTYVILSLWTWSLLQFTLVLTATKARKPRPGVDSSQQDWPTGDGRSRLVRCCNTDIWAMMTTIVFQDAPFLALRLVLIIKYNVVSYFNIFFTCKNSLVLLLQVYRLIVLSCEKQSNCPKGARNDLESEFRSNESSSDVSNHFEKNDYLGFSDSYGRRVSWERPPSSYRSKYEDQEYEYKIQDKHNCLNRDWCRRPFNDGNSAFVSYSQSRNAPWTDVQLLLRSTNSMANVEERNVGPMMGPADCSEVKHRCTGINRDCSMMPDDGQPENETPSRKVSKSKKLRSVSKRNGSKAKLFSAKL